MKNKESLFRYFFLISAILVAFVSLLATTFGLTRYVPFILSLPLSVAVLMGLIGLAWMIGAGRKGRGALFIFLCFTTMLFPITFSYAAFQGLLVEKVKIRESQLELFEDIRNNYLSFARILDQGINRSEDIKVKLKVWMDTEAKFGYATRTCELETDPYLSGLCQRIREHILKWEEKAKRPYNEGPGRSMIYNFLWSELGSIEQINNRLKEFRNSSFFASHILEEDLESRGRLIKYDNLVVRFPIRDLEAILLKEINLPEPISFKDYTRSLTDEVQQQEYIFEDLMKIFSSGYMYTRSDYLTIIALCLAFFINLYVVTVVIAAEYPKGAEETRLRPKSYRIPQKQNKPLITWVKLFIKDMNVSDLIMSGIGCFVGICLLFIGVLIDYIYSIAGVTILALALFHLSWSKKHI